MTATPRVAATTAANQTYTGSVASGAGATFYAHGLKGSERVVFESPDSAGNYIPIRTFEGSGRMSEVYLDGSRTVCRLTGPIDFRIKKPATGQAVEVGEYT